MIRVSSETYDAAKDFWEGYLDTARENGMPLPDVYEQSVLAAAILFAQIMIGKPGLGFIAATTSPWENEKQGALNLCSECHIGTRTQAVSMAKWFIGAMEKQRAEEVDGVMTDVLTGV